MPITYLLLGSNLGNRKENLDKCETLLTAEAGVLIRKSMIYESEPWGFDHPNWFYNQLLVLETRIEAHALLKILLSIEKRMGRERAGTTYIARIIDIDILLYDNLEMNEDQLTIPHPRIEERKFALVPLAEIEPSLCIPGLNQTVWQLLRTCTDTSIVRPIFTPPDTN